MIYWLLSLVVWGSIAYFLYYHRIWLFFYIWTAVGFTIMAILLLRTSPVEYEIEQLTGLILHYLLAYVDVKTYIFDKAPGTVLVLLALENSWTCIDIDIECSGLLEACVLMGLLLFYPTLTASKRFWYALFGLFSLFIVNLIRLFTIVMTLNFGGRDTMFIAHTLLGRLVFFVLIIVVYWYIFTRPSLEKVKRKVDNA